MNLEDSKEDPEKFILRSIKSEESKKEKSNKEDPKSELPSSELELSCSIAEESSGPRRQEWVDAITAILQTQRDFLLAIQSPIAYQKELTKDPL